MCFLVSGKAFHVCACCRSRLLTKMAFTSLRIIPAPKQKKWSVSLGLDRYGLLVRYVKLRVAHAPGMPGTCSLPPLVSDPDMRHGMCVTQVPRGACWDRKLAISFEVGGRENIPGFPGFFIRNPHFYVSGKRPIGLMTHNHMKSQSASIDHVLQFAILINVTCHGDNVFKAFINKILYTSIVE